MTAKIDWSSARSGARRRPKYCITLLPVSWVELQARAAVEKISVGVYVEQLLELTRETRSVSPAQSSAADPPPARRP